MLWLTVPARVVSLPKPARLISRQGTKRLHTLKPLPYPIERGLGKFLPPQALKVLQLEYQNGLLERLNEQIHGTTMEYEDSLTQTVISLSEKRDDILAFNYASLALNNDFFLSNLKPIPDPSPQKPALDGLQNDEDEIQNEHDHQNYENEIQDELHLVIRNAHGDVQQLRSAFSAAVLGTFINGWVWFVTDQAGNTGIVTTYGAGTLLVRSRMNMGRYSDLQPTISGDNPHATLAPPYPSRSSSSLTFPSSPLSGVSGHNPPTVPNDMQVRHMSDHNTIRLAASGVHSNPRKEPSLKNVPMGSVLTAGEILYPLFCVPVYEHAWMSAGYGVWGKEQWIKEFWSVLNWKRVNAAYQAVWRSIHVDKHSQG